MSKNKKQESLLNDVHYDIGLDVYSIKDGSLGVSWNVTHNGEVKDFKSEDLIIAIMIVMIATIFLISIFTSFYILDCLNIFYESLTYFHSLLCYLL